MCGRFSLGLQRRNIVQIVHEAYPDMDLGEWVNEENFHPRHNIAPRSQSLVLRREQAAPQSQVEGSSADRQLSEDINKRVVMHTMKWGLVPHWSKFEDKSLSTSNARAENLVSGGGMWGSIKGRKRCVVLCEGYFEWQTKGKEKLPFFTKPQNGDLMYLAGLYDCVTLEGERDPLWTFTIVTTDANKDFTWLHDRQPVILSNEYEVNTWLDTTSQQWTPELAKLLLPYHNEQSPLDCYQVPKEVGKVGTESESFIHPVSKRKDGIEAMFAKQANRTPKKPTSGAEPPTTPTFKRKRSPSPSITTVDKPKKSGSQDSGDDKAPSASKKESVVEGDVIDLTSAPSSPVRPAQKQDSPSKRKVKNLDTDTKPNSKLTSFFKKSA